MCSNLACLFRSLSTSQRATYPAWCAGTSPLSAPLVVSLKGLTSYPDGGHALALGVLARHHQSNDFRAASLELGGGVRGVYGLPYPCSLTGAPMNEWDSLLRRVVSDTRRANRQATMILSSLSALTLTALIGLSTCSVY